MALCIPPFWEVVAVIVLSVLVQKRGIKDPSQEPPASYYRFFAGYITKLNPTGSELDYSTYFTGKPWSIEIDNCQNVYIAGSAGSSLPTTKGAFQSNYGGDGDGFVAKFEGIPNCVLTGE